MMSVTFCIKILYFFTLIDGVEKRFKDAKRRKIEDKKQEDSNYSIKEKNLLSENNHNHYSLDNLSGKTDCIFTKYPFLNDKVCDSCEGLHDFFSGERTNSILRNNYHQSSLKRTHDNAFLNSKISKKNSDTVDTGKFTKPENMNHNSVIKPSNNLQDIAKNSTDNNEEFYVKKWAADTKQIILDEKRSATFLKTIFTKCRNKKRIYFLRIALKRFIVETNRIEIVPLLFTYIRMTSNHLMDLESNLNSINSYRRAGLIKVDISFNFNEIFDICKEKNTFWLSNKSNISEYISEPCIRSFYISIHFFNNKLPTNNPAFDDMMSGLRMNINENSKDEEIRIYQEWKNNFIDISNILTSSFN